MEKWEYIGSSPGTDGTVVSFRKTTKLVTPGWFPWDKTVVYTVYPPVSTICG